MQISRIEKYTDVINIIFVDVFVNLHQYFHVQTIIVYSGKWKYRKVVVGKHQLNEDEKFYEVN